MCLDGIAHYSIIVLAYVLLSEVITPSRQSAKSQMLLICSTHEKKVIQAKFWILVSREPVHHHKILTRRNFNLTNLKNTERRNRKKTLKALSYSRV